MTQIKASSNKAETVETAQTQSEIVGGDKKPPNATTVMVRERLKFYVEQFNSLKKQQLELKEQLKQLEESGLKLSGSINALNELLKSSEGLS